jgi:predicted nuclease with RNAse H fold
MQVRKLVMGWDVGAWHCDNNRRSRDALVLLDCTDGTPKPFGRWRGNLRKDMENFAGMHLVYKMLANCNLRDCEVFDLTTAIDAPLGWPEPMLRLVNGNDPSETPKLDGSNQYTRRRTDIELIRRGYRPLSTVRDMIGSQSTKAIHFLCRAGLRLTSPGVWKSHQSRTSIAAIETYPAVARSSDRLSQRVEILLRDPLFHDAHSDDEDALVCALVAHFFADSTTEKVPTNASGLEGWIILPDDLRSASTTQNGGPNGARFAGDQSND